MTNPISPCGYCTRVSDPRECENKNCMLWRKWYIDRWDTMRAAIRVRMDAPGVPVGVCVSGTYYAAPLAVGASNHQSKLREVVGDATHSAALC